MSKRFTATEKWDDPWFRKLPNEYKCLWDYICSKCDLIGIWKVDFEMVNFCLNGSQTTQERALELFNSGKERVQVLNCGSIWLVVEFIHFQYGDLNPNNNLHRSIISRIEKLRGRPGANEPLVSPCSGAYVKVKVKEKVKVDKEGGMGETKIPTIDDVRQYCEERSNSVDPQKWHDFYSAKGWMIGKNKMKDWKAAVRTWEKGDAGTLTETQIRNIKRFQEFEKRSGDDE